MRGKWMGALVRRRAKGKIRTGSQRCRAATACLALVASATIGLTATNHKGSLDAPILDLIHDINDCPEGNVYTTSSCSGRITLFRQAPNQRKGGTWDICSHEKVTLEDVHDVIFRKKLPEKKGDSAEDGENVMTFRFEPFILCCECEDMASAYKLLSVANKTGMRESGIMGSCKRILVGIRCSLRMELPVRIGNKALISEDYARFIVHMANDKFEENLKRIAAFRKEFKRSFYPSTNTIDEKMIGKGIDNEYQGYMLLCRRRDTKKIKDFLKTENLLPSRSIFYPAQPIAPVTDEDMAAAAEQRMMVALPPNSTRLLLDKGGTKYIAAKTESSHVWLEKNKVKIPSRLKGGNSEVKAKRSTGSWERMKSEVRRVLSSDARWHKEMRLTGNNKSELIEKILETIPKKWHRIGDIVLFSCGTWLIQSHGPTNQDAFSVAEEGKLLPLQPLPTSLLSLGKPLWLAIQSSLHTNRNPVTRIALQGRVSEGRMRIPKVIIVHDSRGSIPKGDIGGWVTHKEDGLVYRLDVTRSMFSAGNGSEKKRVGEICKAGDVVVDLYAGIGYFTLPYLVHGKASHVHACEINPASVKALCQALKLNKISEDRCTVYPFDNKELQLYDVADRVNLGLLPSAEKGFIVAIRALKPEGGYLHVHGNCLEEDIVTYAENLRQKIESLSRGSKGEKKSHVEDSGSKHPELHPRKQWWKVRIVHIEKVKWYAPRVRHIVVDLQCALS